MSHENVERVAAIDVGIDLLAGERLEAHDRLGKPLAQGAVGGSQGNGGKHAMAATGET